MLFSGFMHILHGFSTLLNISEMPQLNTVCQAEKPEKWTKSVDLNPRIHIKSSLALNWFFI